MTILINRTLILYLTDEGLPDGYEDMMYYPFNAIPIEYRIFVNKIEGIIDSGQCEPIPGYSFANFFAQLYSVKGKEYLAYPTAGRKAAPIGYEIVEHDTVDDELASLLAEQYYVGKSGDKYTFIQQMGTAPLVILRKTE
jgi:hypothetical protein